MYSRVFLQILDSSIAEDFTTRHIFEDLLKLADHKTGVVDMTREAISRRLNVPLDVLNASIDKLESPDKRSRDPEHDGRRLGRLDSHRDWGWLILNWSKYQQIKCKADAAMRVQRHRASQRELLSPLPFTRPTIEEVNLHGAKMGLPPIECEKFFNYYEANGWRVGKNPMRQWRSAMANWKSNWQERHPEIANNNHTPKPSDPNVLKIGTAKFTRDNPPTRGMWAEGENGDRAFKTYYDIWQKWAGNPTT